MNLSRLRIGIYVLIPFLAVAAYLYLAPRLTLSQNEFDMGTLEKGCKKNAVLFLRNVGCRTLCILGVDSSCECTTAKIDKQVLKPGESAKVDIELDSSTLSGDVYRLITIRTDAPVNGTLFIPMSCRIVDSGSL